MNIEGLSLDQLHELQGAIIKEARRRIKEAESIVNVGPVDRKPHGNSGRKHGVVLYPDEKFVRACESGLSSSATARLLGCHPSLVSLKARKLGLEFTPAKGGRPRVSH